MKYPVVFVAIVVLLGAGLRLSTLDKRSITHPEMYVPGIRLPAAISEPAERLTITSILTGTFSSDTHPPGYYLAMFPWTRIAGTSLQAIRLPSALLGIACIPLLYAVGALIGRPGAGAAAAAMLALSGYHVFWSQVARMFALSCFLGLCATVLLLWIVRFNKPRPLATAVYVAVLLAGVTTHVFFWGILATHLIWALGNGWGLKRLPVICRAQLLALILGSPLIAFAGYQSGNVVADLSRDVPSFVADLVSFGFVLPAERSGFFPDAVPFTGAWAWWVLRAAVALTGAALLTVGLGRLWREGSGKAVLVGSSNARMTWRIAWIVAGIFGSLAIMGFLAMSLRLPADQLHPTIRITKALLPLPVLVALFAVVLDALWVRLPAAGNWRRAFAGEQPLIALLAVVPFTLLSLLALVRPVLNQRGLMVVAPYVLLVMAAGLVSLRSKLWIAASCAVASIAFASGIVGYGRMTVDPADYRQFASAVKAEIHSQDLVFVRKAWYETPIFYYLTPDRYRLIGRNFTQAAGENPEARIWAVLLYEDQTPDEMRAALRGYRITRTITMPHAHAFLFEPAAIQSLTAGVSR